MTHSGKPIPANSHSSCPGRAAYIATTFGGIEAVYVCTEWRTHGHRDRYQRESGQASGAMSEQAKAERREVIARNKEWKSATTVRRDFLTTLLARKAPPKGAASYVAVELALGSHPVRRAFDHAHQLAATLLEGDTGRTRHGIAERATAAPDARAQVITLGLVLGAVEESTGPHTWRNPDDVSARYFAFLSANGYALTEVEQLVAGTHTAPRRRRSTASQDTTAHGATTDSEPADPS